MTHQRQLKQRLAGMQEISEIMNGMKNLAYIETRKLVRLLRNQERVVEQIEQAAGEFLSWHPGLMPAAETAQRVWLVIGSKRGFCGDFNDSLATAINAELADSTKRDLIVAVGRKLSLRLEDTAGIQASLEGGDVAEELPGVLQAVVVELGRLLPQRATASLLVLYHTTETRSPRRLKLLPPFAAYSGETMATGYPPQLNLSAQEFLLGLVEQYLYASLHSILGESLLAENESRMRHLEGALHHLEGRADTIQQRIRLLRQEEITEEIEVILLNAAGLQQPGAKET